MKKPNLIKQSKQVKVWVVITFLLACSQVITRARAQEAESRLSLAPPKTTVDVDALAAYIEQARIDWGVPGLSVAIVKDDELVLSRGFGVRHHGRDEAVDEHTLFAIASNSKAFTSAALAILVDEGKLQWDDPVANTLPWLKLKDPLAADLRIRDLLCHRSGLGTFSGDLLWWGTSYTPRQVLERAAYLEPATPFRSSYGYSNLMFLAAGEVIERITLMPWSKFVQQRILEPLEMQRTITSIRDLIGRENFATPHKTLLDRSQPLPWQNWDAMVAAGGVISSAHDMSHWLRLQLRRGAVRPIASGENQLQQIFSTKQSETMWESHIPISVSAGHRQRFPTTHFRSYGLGWALSDYRGRKLVGHGGGYDGMYSEVLMVPEENLGVVILTNSMTNISPAVSYRVMDAYLGGEARDWSAEGLSAFRRSRVAFNKQVNKVTEPVALNTTPSQSLTNFTGRFRCPMYGDALVEIENEKLVLKLLPNPDLVADLEHLHYDTFVIRWRKESAWFDAGTAHFVTDSRGVFRKLELDVPNDDLWFYELNLSRQD